MDADLAEKLHRRIRRIESVESSSETSSTNELEFCSSLNNEDYQRPTVFNPYLECNEFSRKQIQSLMEIFDKYDTDKDKSLNFNELKYIMEKLGVPQTHLGLKSLIKRGDNDHDGKISFREFLFVFRKVVSENSDYENDKSLILYKLYAMLLEIDVSKEGVVGAKNFFEAKAAAVQKGDKFQREIREEQEQRRRIEEEKLRRKLAFQTRLAQFQF